MPKSDYKFFLPMIPPTVTLQEQKTGVRNGKPYRYDPPELKDARAKFIAYLSQHIPQEPLSGPVALQVITGYPITGDHCDGEWKTTKPDTDNTIKLLKDCMTKLHFWKDDAQVALEINQKLWAEDPGIWIQIKEL